jgi:hypothetical protein
VKNVWIVRPVPMFARKMRLRLSQKLRGKVKIKEPSIRRRVRTVVIPFSHLMWKLRNVMYV